jgi:hypothetical protein
MISVRKARFLRIFTKISYLALFKILTTILGSCNHFSISYPLFKIIHLTREGMRFYYSYNVACEQARYFWASRPAPIKSLLAG